MTIKALNSIGMGCDVDAYTELNGVYYGTNPLLKNGVRGTTLGLNAPNLYENLHSDNSGRKDNIYTPRVQSVGGVYNTYGDIHSGQYIYYIDDATRDAYLKPNFISPMVVATALKTDPNNIRYFRYDRASCTPCSWDPNVKCGIATRACDVGDCNSETHDVLFHRQDLMSRQMSKMNQQKYSAAWSYYNQS